MRCFIRLIIVAAVAAALPSPPAAHGRDKDTSPPLKLSVHLGKSSSGYGSPVGLKVRLHNPGKKTVTVFNDGRLGGALRVEFVDDHGLVWRPVPPTPQVHASRSIIVRWPRQFFPLPTKPIKAGENLDLRFTLRNFELVNGPRGDRTIQWYEVLPPGRYRVRAVYEKQDDRVVVHQPVLQNSRLIEITSDARFQSIPGLWTGRLQGEAVLTVTAPSRADVDALRKRIKVLEATNRALKKKLDAIRAVVGAK